MKFHKYNATGNDFILFDGRKELSLKTHEIQKLCERRIGIGADGLILLGFDKDTDFSMKIFNSDGREASMCGNGARALIHYAHYVLRMKSRPEYRFKTMNGIYEAEIREKMVKVKMTELYDVNRYQLNEVPGNRALYLNTGVPHFVIEVNDIDKVEVEKVSPALRSHKNFPGGANIDFFQMKGDVCYVRTFERGVEAETLACGTGVVATAETVKTFYGPRDELKVKTKGGELAVEWKNNERWFSGAVEIVYAGELVTERA
ncbi:MAG: diaminopimelate epimerase [Bacteriovoracaceae bacterium]